MTSPILPQHWLRPEHEPHPYWCPLCRCPVTKWHEHHGPSKNRM